MGFTPSFIVLHKYKTNEEVLVTPRRILFAHIKNNKTQVVMNSGIILYVNENLQQIKDKWFIWTPKNDETKSNSKSIKSKQRSSKVSK